MYEIILLTNKSERTRIKEHDIKARNEICRISVIDIEQIEKLMKGQNIQEDIINNWFILKKTFYKNKFLK